MMLKYATRRVLGIVPVVVLISAVCFGLMHAVPGGPEGMLAQNPKIGADDLSRIRTNFGLDDPVAVQYGKWLARVVLHGDLGYSYTTGEPVIRMILSRLPATVLLMGSAFVIALLLGMAVGIVYGLRPHTRWDVFVTILSLVLIAIPVFWSGLMAILVFSVHWKLLPSAGMRTLGGPAAVADCLRHLALPSLVLALVFAANWSRYVRTSLGDVMSQEYIRTARAKGLSAWSVVFKHAARNAAAPVITVVALQLPLLFGGAVIVETVFSWPGMGRLFYDGLVRLDYSRVMGIILVSSVLMVATNILVDWIYGYIDPRIRHAK